MAYRFIVTGALSAVVLLAGCSGGEKTPGKDATGGTGGEGGAGPAECATDGTGTVELGVSGLPDGLVPDCVFAAMSPGSSLREEFSADVTYEDVATGDYMVSCGVVFEDDPIVRTLYEPVISQRDFCLEPGATQVVSVSYEALPSSNKLWTSSLVGFSSSELRASTTPEAIVVEASAGKDLAFDGRGNLWALGGTVADPQVVRFPAAVLGTSGPKDWDVGINVPAVDCLPAIRALAFSPPDLWLSVCGDRLMKFTGGMFAESGDLTPDLTISEVPGNEDIAATAAGLWVATGSSILLYKGRRDGASSDPAELTLTVRDAEDSRDLDPSGVTFDADGNLWGFCFGSNFVFEIAAAELDQTGERTVVADLSFVLGVDVLVATGAFDNAGTLWVSYGGGRLGRISTAGLSSSGPGDPVTPDEVFTSDALDNGLNLAFFAKPPGVPLGPFYD